MLNNIISLIGAALVVLGSIKAVGEPNVLERIAASLVVISGTLCCILSVLYGIYDRLRRPK